MRTPPPTVRNASNPSNCSRTSFRSKTSAPPISARLGNAANASSPIRSALSFSSMRTSPTTFVSFGNTARITRLVRTITTDPPTCVSSGNAPRRDVSAAPGATTTSPSTRSTPTFGVLWCVSLGSDGSVWNGSVWSGSPTRFSRAAASVNAGCRRPVTTSEPAMVEHRAASGVVLASTTPEQSESAGARSVRGDADERARKTRQENTRVERQKRTRVSIPAHDRRRVVARRRARAVRLARREILGGKKQAQTLF